MSNADIILCFRVIDLEDVKYKGFKEDGKYYLAEQVRLSKNGMDRMLAALLGQPVEKLAEIREINLKKTLDKNPETWYTDSSERAGELH